MILVQIDAGNKFMTKFNVGVSINANTNITPVNFLAKTHQIFLIYLFSNFAPRNSEIDFYKMCFL